MKKLKNAPKKQRGATLIEMIVALIVIILIVAAASGRIGNVFGKAESSEEVTSMNQLIVSTKTLRGAGGYGTGSLVSAVIASEGVPKAMPLGGGGTTILNAWGQPVTIVGNTLGFIMTTTAVPKPACIEMANKVSRGGAMSVKINGNAAINGEVDSVTATNQCNGTPPANNTLIFTINN